MRAVNGGSLRPAALSIHGIGEKITRADGPPVHDFAVHVEEPQPPEPLVVLPRRRNEREAGLRLGRCGGSYSPSRVDSLARQVGGRDDSLGLTQRSVENGRGEPPEDCCPIAVQDSECDERGHESKALGELSGHGWAFRVDPERSGSSLRG